MFYIAMRQVYEPKKDESGETVLEEYTPSWWRNRYFGEKPKRAVYEKVEGKFQPFGANGKVISLYDSPAKAKRYCGKEGYVAQVNPDDCIKFDASVEEQFKHCEARMLFWGTEADRLEKLMESVNE